MARMVDSIALGRAKHPGGKMSLDALCTRYGIDRSHRTKHGALLDAELLAQLYIELTGGKQIGLQLVSDAAETAAQVKERHQLIVANRPLRAARPHSASGAELERHQAFIATIKDAMWVGRDSPPPA
jgi:DNA polymerase III subunit epsilon